MTTQQDKDDLLAKAETATAQIDTALDALTTARATMADLSASIEALPVSAPEARFLVGMSYGGNSDPSAFEALAGVPLGIWRLYYQASEVAKATTAIATAGTKKRDVVWASFKMPASWADMGAGKQDTWVRDMGKRISDAAVAAGVQVWLTYHHEPEGDAPLADFQAMYRHCMPLLAGLPNVTRWVIATGYPQVFGGGQAAWTLDAMCLDASGKPLVDGIGVDPYLMYGTYQDYNHTPPMVTTWTDPADRYFKPFSDYAKNHALRWAVAETGITNEAYAQTLPGGAGDGPGWMAKQTQVAASLGADGWSYFASTLNSRGSWELDSVPAKRSTFCAQLARAKA